MSVGSLLITGSAVMVSPNAQAAKPTANTAERIIDCAVARMVLLDLIAAYYIKFRGSE